MSLFDIYKAKQLGAGAGSLFASAAGKKLSPAESFNKWDEEWELGAYDLDTGEKVANSSRIRSTNAFKVIPDTVYYYKSSANAMAIYYKADGSYVGFGYDLTANKKFTTPSDADTMAIRFTPTYGTTYKNDTCVNISCDRDGEYQPHGKP